MKLNNSESTKYALRDIYKMPAGPDRMARFLRLVDADVALLPLSASPPAAVTAAHAEYLSATSVARQTAAGVETAKEAAGTAAGADLSAAMQSIQAGKILPKSTTQPKAADAIAAALTFTTAAENLVGEAQAHLVDAVQVAWPEWRPQIIRDAAAARVKAAAATKEAAEAVATGRALFAAVTSLDHEVLSRDAKLLQSVSDETRQGIGWYGGTHIGTAPLQHVSIPGVEHNKRPTVLDLAVVVEAVAASVADPETFPASDWVPPTDDAHADLLTQPLDPDQLWVRSAIRREWGDTCVVCKRGGADVAVEVVGAAWSWAMAHRTCRDKGPDPKAQRNAERLAKMQREGFPPSPNEATQIVPDGGRVQKDKGFGG